MAAQRRDGPSYRLHAPSGQAIVTIAGRTIYLGPYGSPESRQRYERALGEHAARGRFVSSARLRAGIAVDDLIAGYWKHAEEYYRKDGRPTSELSVLRLACRYLHRIYGSTSASEFGPLKLKAVRERMIEDGLTRTTVNGYVARIKQAFRWGVENELVPAAVFHGLQAVRGLARGRTRAREPQPVRPVGDAEVEAVLPHLPPAIAAMVELQLWTGMRPGEVVQMRGRDLDRSGAVWLYRPQSHKNEHHELERVVPLGPKAQAVLGTWLKLDPDAFLFTPADAEACRNAERRAGRESPRWPSHSTVARRRRRGQSPREYGDRYDVSSYRRAIARGCEAAGIEPWSPNRLRHTAATRIRRELGIEAAQAVLGHRLIETTQVYAEVSQARAIDAMARLG
ncbi:MAG: tyrosine-type recombinase/integrase [Planctomycetes bacterium]|nr:tyrosine-type recombinase/integrase [Planctomycetota bacterium]